MQGETKTFTCILEGREISGLVHTGYSEIRDYTVTASVDGSPMYEFEMRMVSTPPKYKVPFIIKPDQTCHWLPRERSALVADKEFEFGIRVVFVLEKIRLKI